MRRKNLPAVLLCLALALPLLGCEKEPGYTFVNPRATSRAPGVGEALEAGMAGFSEPAASTPPLRPEELAANNPALASRPPEPQKAPKTPGIDVDLSSMGGNIAFAQLYCMLRDPGDYLGQKVKIHGVFTTHEDSQSGERYYGCVIQDETACCAQGLEFMPAEAFHFPEDFPGDKQEITVSGVFNLYTASDGNQYCRLFDAEILKN